MYFFFLKLLLYNLLQSQPTHSDGFNFFLPVQMVLSISVQADLMLNSVLHLELFYECFIPFLSPGGIWNNVHITAHKASCVKWIFYNLCKINRCKAQPALSDMANELNLLCKWLLYGG